LFNHTHLKIYHWTNHIYIISEGFKKSRSLSPIPRQDFNRNRSENTHTAMKYCAVPAQTATCSATGRRKRSEGNTHKMVSNVNHFCGFVNTELRI
jgi:hypothetical protein